MAGARGAGGGRCGTSAAATATATAVTGTAAATGAAHPRAATAPAVAKAELERVRLPAALLRQRQPAWRDATADAEAGRPVSSHARKQKFGELQLADDAHDGWIGRLERLGGDGLVGVAVVVATRSQVARRGACQARRCRCCSGGTRTSTAAGARAGAARRRQQRKREQYHQLRRLGPAASVANDREFVAL